MEQQNNYKIDRRKLTLTIGVIVTAALILWFTFRKKHSEVKDILVEVQHLQDGQNDLIKETDIKQIIRKGFDKKMDSAPIGDVDIARVEGMIKQDPFVENAESFIDVSGNLNVKVTQKEPILRIIDNNGQNYYLDKKGFRIPLSKYFAPRVTIITGAVPPYMIDFLSKKNYVLNHVFTLVQTLNSDPFFEPMIQQIIVDATGEFTLIPIIGDQKIRIGTLDDLNGKLERIKIFYKEALPYEGWQKYKTISVKYKGQIVCKKK